MRKCYNNNIILDLFSLKEFDAFIWAIGPNNIIFNISIILQDY